MFPDFLHADSNVFPVLLRFPIDGQLPTPHPDPDKPATDDLHDPPPEHTREVPQRMEDADIPQEMPGLAQRKTNYQCLSVLFTDNITNHRVRCVNAHDGTRTFPDYDDQELRVYFEAFAY